MRKLLFIFMFIMNIQVVQGVGLGIGNIAVLDGPKEVAPNKYRAELLNMITPNPSDYEALFKFLNEATLKDELTIVIDRNFGGAVFTLVLLNMSLDSTKATVKFEVKQMAFSAAASILAHSDVVRIDHNALLLWHTGSVDGEIIRPGSYAYETTSGLSTFIFNKSIICIHLYVCIYNPFEKSLVSRQYWENFKKGDDRFVNGEEVCRNIGSRTRVDENGMEYCLIRGLKGRPNGRIESIN